MAELSARTSGAVFADLDADGDLELYVANNAKAKASKPEHSRHSVLFRNDKGTLVDVSDASRACPASLFTARNVGILDYDGDGKLDLFIIEDKFTRSPRSALLRNKGNLEFEDVTKAAGLPEDLFGLGLAVADLNGDRRPDLFIPHSNRLFLSGKDGYREAPREPFAYQPLDGEDWPCGAAFGDVNLDGRLDLVVSAHHDPARNRLWLNDGLKDGIPQFREITADAGLGDRVPTKCPHVEIQDFNNDGLPDIYVSAAWMDNGVPVPLIYRNTGVKDGLPRFEPPRPIKGPMVYYPAGPTADYDADGRLDIFLVNWFSGRGSVLLHNDSAKRRWLQVRINDAVIGLGSTIRVTRDGKLLGFQELSIGYGYASGQQAIAHFGLGDAEEVDVEIVKPGGKTVKKTLKTNQLWVTE
jgi:hypothetical protein